MKNVEKRKAALRRFRSNQTRLAKRVAGLTEMGYTVPPSVAKLVTMAEPKRIKDIEYQAGRMSDFDTRSLIQVSSHYDYMTNKVTRGLERLHTNALEVMQAREQIRQTAARQRWYKDNQKRIADNIISRVWEEFNDALALLGAPMSHAEYKRGRPLPPAMERRVSAVRDYIQGKIDTLGKVKFAEIVQKNADKLYASLAAVLRYDSDDGGVDDNSFENFRRLFEGEG